MERPPDEAVRPGVFVCMKDGFSAGFRLRFFASCGKMNVEIKKMGGFCDGSNGNVTGTAQHP